MVRSARSSQLARVDAQLSNCALHNRHGLSSMFQSSLLQQQGCSNRKTLRSWMILGQCIPLKSRGRYIAPCYDNNPGMVPVSCSWFRGCYASLYVMVPVCCSRCMVLRSCCWSYGCYAPAFTNGMSCHDVFVVFDLLSSSWSDSGSAYSPGLASGDYVRLLYINRGGGR